MLRPKHLFISHIDITKDFEMETLQYSIRSK